MFSKILKTRYFPHVLLAFFSIVMLGSFHASSNKACAQNLESNVCDPNIWETIVGRAWIEAQREIEMNQSFITQPDSVLELSCFDAFAHHAAQTVGQFSNSLTAGALETVVTASAIGAAQSYLAAAGFTGNALGGGSMSGENYTMQAGASFANQCDAMVKVWTHFKCSNMPDLSMVIFDNISANDPRISYAGNTANRCPDAGGTGLYDDKDVWDAAVNRLNSPAVAGTVANYFDIVTTFSNITSPTGACPGPIATGVTIVKTNGDTAAEMICPNPGCSYNGTSCAR